MKQRWSVLLSLLILSFCSIGATAQTSISEEKRAVIAEIVTVVKMDKQMAEITDSILKEMSQSFPFTFNAVIDGRNDLTQMQKEKVKSMTADVSKSVMDKFRARVPLVVDYNKYINESIYPLYDKYYSVQELKDVLAFYRSATGQKVIETMPKLFADAQVMAREKLVPQLIPLIQEITREEFDKILPAAGAHKKRVY